MPGTLEVLPGRCSRVPLSGGLSPFSAWLRNGAALPGAATWHPQAQAQHIPAGNKHSSSAHTNGAAHTHTHTHVSWTTGTHEEVSVGQVPPVMLEHQLACKNEGLCSWEQKSRAVFAALSTTVRSWINPVFSVNAQHKGDHQAGHLLPRTCHIIHTFTTATASTCPYNAACKPNRTKHNQPRQAGRAQVNWAAWYKLRGRSSFTEALPASPPRALVSPDLIYHITAFSSTNKLKPQLSSSFSSFDLTISVSNCCEINSAVPLSKEPNSKELPSERANKPEILPTELKPHLPPCPRSGSCLLSTHNLHNLHPSHFTPSLQHHNVLGKPHCSHGDGNDIFCVKPAAAPPLTLTCFAQLPQTRATPPRDTSSAPQTIS